MRNDGSIHSIYRSEWMQEQHRSNGQATGGDAQKISIVVSDGNYMNSQLLAAALGRMKSITVLKSTVSYSETLEAIVGLQPEVAVLDLHFADGPYKGLELMRRLRDLSARSRCVVLMDDSEREGVVEAFRAGARAIFRRSTSTSLLGRCIAAVHRGELWANSADVLQVIQALQTTMPFKGVNSRGEALLTKREQELIPLVANGLTNKEISTQLGVSEHTIKNHLFRIYEKLGISSRVELILYAVSEREKGQQNPMYGT